MKAFLFCILFLVSTVLVKGQNLIDFKYNEIRKYMRENKKDMNLNKVNNSKFNYLKYSNSSDSQTVLFFLDSDSVCRSIRIIFDQDLKSQKVKEMDSFYHKEGTNRWSDSKDGKLYNIELRDEEWSSVITIAPGK